MDSYDSEYNNILKDIETSTTGPEITGNTVVDTILNTDSVSSFRKKLTNATYSAQAKNQVIKDKTLEKLYTIDGFKVFDVTFADSDSGYRADGTKFRFEDVNRIDAVDLLSNLSDSKKKRQPDYVSSMVGKPVDSLTEEDYRNLHDYQAIQLQKLVTDPNYVIENYDPSTTYTYNKAPVKLALKVVGKDDYGRDLVEAINPATGRNLSFDLSNNPYLNANFDIYKSLDSITEAVNNTIAYDRIINNHNKLNRRYNLDRFVKESVFTTDQATDTIYEFCKLIDTYDIPLKAKYSIAIENSLYAYEKNYVPYDKQSILEAVTDYFLMTHNENGDMLGIIANTAKKTLMYEQADFDKLDLIPANSPEYMNIFTEETIDGLAFYENYNANSNMRTLITESKDSKIKDKIKKFKLKPKKDISDLKDLIRGVLMNHSQEAIDETPNILGMIFVFFVLAGTFAISVVAGAITLMTMIFVGIKWSEDECDKQIKHYKDHIKKVKNRIAKAKSEKEKERLNEYLNSLEKNLEKLEDYRENLKSDIQKQREEEEENKKSEESSNDDFSLESVKNIADDLFVLEKAIENITKNKIDISTIQEKINNINNANIDAITEFSIKNPDLIHPEELSEILTEQREDTLKLVDVNKYVRSTILSENITKLNNFKYDISEECSIQSALHEMANTIITRDIIEESLLYTKESQTPLLELSFTNTINMAIERVKKAATDLSDKEKIMSKTVDQSLENFGRGITDVYKTENREAIIRGNVLPPASRIIKMAIITGLAFLVHPALAVISVLGHVAMAKETRAKERSIILDELDVELDMCNRYIKQAEDKNDLKAVRQCLMIKKKLEAQRNRLRYKMEVEYKDDVPASANNDNDSDY